MSAGPILPQRRARHAWSAVEEAKRRLSANDRKDYAGEAKRLPARIAASGLGQAVAWLNAKHSRGQNLLTTHLARWLLVERRLVGRAAARPNPTDIDGKALCKAIIEGDADLLRRATEEARAWLQWLARFAEAEIRTEED